MTTQDTPILGDFNAHDPSWYSRSTDTVGKIMGDSINVSDYGILNWNTPMRVAPNIELSLSDVSLASIITSCSWQTLLTLSSDHLPIFIRLQMKTASNPGLRRTHVNLKKDNWDRYRQEVEATLSMRAFPTDWQRDDGIFRTVLLKSITPHPYLMTCTSRYNGRDDQTWGDLRKEPARWRSLLWALDLGLVVYECLPPIPPIPPSGTPIIGSNTIGSCPWIALSSLKDIQYRYSSKWNNPDA